MSDFIDVSEGLSNAYLMTTPEGCIHRCRRPLPSELIGASSDGQTIAVDGGFSIAQTVDGAA